MVQDRIQERRSLLGFITRGLQRQTASTYSDGPLSKQNVFQLTARLGVGSSSSPPRPEGGSSPTSKACTFISMPPYAFTLCSVSSNSSDMYPVISRVSFVFLFLCVKQVAPLPPQSFPVHCTRSSFHPLPHTKEPLQFLQPHYITWQPTNFRKKTRLVYIIDFHRKFELHCLRTDSHCVRSLALNAIWTIFR